MVEINYDKVCFVIMPFNKKMVGGKEVDFNFIYDRVFKPAIESGARSPRSRWRWRCAACCPAGPSRPGRR
jgi:hypothetical protein